MGPHSVQELFRSETFFGITSNAGAEDPAAADQRLADLMFNVVHAPCANLDGRFADALRNTLFGEFGEDLSTRNMFRSQDMGMQPYRELARCYGTWPNWRVRRYASRGCV